MQPRKYTKWTPRLRRGVIKQWQLGITPISQIERWFGTYKLEFQPQRWSLDEFVEIYNKERLHQGIGYKTPLERYNCANNSV